MRESKTLTANAVPQANGCVRYSSVSGSSSSSWSRMLFNIRYWLKLKNIWDNISFQLLTRSHVKYSSFFSHIFGYVHTVFLFIALGHSCINPFIYFWTDARVRFGFLDLIGSIPGVKRCCRGVQWDNNFGRWERFFLSYFQSEKSGKVDFDDSKNI